MKNILKSTLLLFCALGMFTACSDDNDDNPVLKTPTTFVLNTPALAENGVYDLANSTSLELTCSQPDYGFPASTKYTVQVATKSDMSDARDLSTTYTTAKMDLDVEDLAATLTDQLVAQGKTEADFPIDLPVYLRVKANMLTAMGGEVEGQEILSNVVTLKHVHLVFSLPPVSAPEKLYVVGEFNSWSWDTALEMTPVNGATHIFWHLVYIDEKGIKFNTATAWDGNEVGFAKINLVKMDGETAATANVNDKIVDGSGNIAASTAGWYLMVVDAVVEGRNIVYNCSFYEPNVYLMGLVTKAGDWSELEDAAKFTVPTKANGDFVSPAFATTVPGGATSDDQGVRAYVKVPGFDWWKTEFIIYDGKITYRGNGGDQTPRVAGSVNQQLRLNFSKDTGEIK